MSTPTTQETLQQLHETIAHLIAHHGSGILTDLEFVYAIGNAGIDAKLAFFKSQQPIHEADLSGLIDLNTGLRYPSKANTKNDDKLTGGQHV